MSDTVTNELLLEHLRRIRGDIGALRDDFAEMKSDIRGVKLHLMGFLQTDSAHEEAIASIRVRLDRIERRIELNDAP